MIFSHAPTLLAGGASRTGVVFQSDFDGRNSATVAFDQSPVNRPITFSSSGAELRTSQPKFGRSSVFIVDDLGLTGSVRIDGEHADFQPEGDYTWEGFFYIDTFSDGHNDIFSKWRSENGRRAYILRRNFDTGRIEFLYSTDGNSSMTIGWLASLSENAWHHIAVVILSGVVSVFVDGTELSVASGSATLSGTIFSSPEGFRLGAHHNSSGEGVSQLDGYCDDVRVTKGVARYTVNFTAPAEPNVVQGSVWGGYTWWQYPLSRREGDVTYVGHVGVDGAQRVSRIDNESHIVEQTEVVGAYPVDDHNAPAIERMGDGDLIVAYTGHNDDSVLRYRTGLDLDNLGSEQTLSMSGDTTYAQLFVRGSNVFFFTRIGAQAWALRHSSDNAANWNASQDIVELGVSDLFYVVGRYVSDSVVQFLVTRNGVEANNSFRVFDIDLSTGVASSDGTALGNIDGSSEGGNSLPAAFSDLATLYSAATDHTIRLLDVADDASAFSYADTDDLGDTTYHVAYFTGSDRYDPDDWSHKEIIPAGVFFFASSEYSGGVMFDRTDPSNHSLYIAREDSGTWFIEHWTTADGGDNWSSDEVESASDVLIRPLSPVGASADLPVLWQRGSYTSFTNFDLATRFR